MSVIVVRNLQLSTALFLDYQCWFGQLQQFNCMFTFNNWDLSSVKPVWIFDAVMLFRFTVVHCVSKKFPPLSSL